MISRPGERAAFDGGTICIHEWGGSGPATMHVHLEDDEAWHVLEGELRFRFSDREESAPAGTSVFVPAGVAHAYEAPPGARYLIVLTPRLRDLIEALHGAAPETHAEIYQLHRSQLLE